MPANRRAGRIPGCSGCRGAFTGNLIHAVDLRANHAQDVKLAEADLL